MDVIIGCPNCGAQFQASEAYAGRDVACPKCGRAVRISGPIELDPRLQPAFSASAGESEPLRSTSGADSGSPVGQRSTAPIMSSFISANLMPGEHLVVVSRIHPLVLVVPLVFAGLGLLMFVIGMLSGDKDLVAGVVGPGAIVGAIGGVVALGSALQRLTTEYSCTDRRILIKSGFITTRLREMPLAKVEALYLQQGLLGKIFGYGTLAFKGSGGTRRVCKNVDDPFRFYKRVQEQVAASQGRTMTREVG